MSDASERRQRLEIWREKLPDDHTSETEEYLLGETPNASKSGESPVTRQEFDQLQVQNNKILEQLANLTKYVENTPPPDSGKAPASKQKRARNMHSESEGEGPTEEYDVGGERYRPNKRAKKGSESFMDVDEQVDILMSNQAPDLDLDLDALDSSEEMNEMGLDLANIAQEYDKEVDVGPKISENLANLVQVMKRGQMSDEKMKEKCSKYKQPENCKLAVPRVNAEIWDSMEHTAKGRDLKAQSIQKYLLKATCALTSVTDRCLANKDLSGKAVCKEIMDAIGLVLKANREISQDRRAKIVLAPQMNRQYRKLLSNDIPVTDNLFGDDLRTVCASIESTSKLGKNFTMSSRGRKFMPRPKNWDTQYFQRGRGRDNNRYQQRGRRGYFRGRGQSTFPQRRDQ